MYVLCAYMSGYLYRDREVKGEVKNGKNINERQ